LFSSSVSYVCGPNFLGNLRTNSTATKEAASQSVEAGLNIVEARGGYLVAFRYLWSLERTSFTKATTIQGATLKKEFEHSLCHPNPSIIYRINE
jgi:hypothetical protein